MYKYHLELYVDCRCITHMADNEFFNKIEILLISPLFLSFLAEFKGTLNVNLVECTYLDTVAHYLFYSKCLDSKIEIVNAMKLLQANEVSKLHSF